ncbi:hypothetical protein CKO51_29615 [Rhodopirellula sp. SM50]|nr:hypothetical protein CKO51_29615 [Rhodopirellula sp. SM50]
MSDAVLDDWPRGVMPAENERAKRQGKVDASVLKGEIPLPPLPTHSLRAVANTRHVRACFHTGTGAALPGVKLSRGRQDKMS